MSWGLVAVGVGTAGAAAINTFGGKKSSSVSQSPLETPEQAEARRKLLAFSETGKLGDYQAGKAYTGSLGDFGISALETSGLNQIGKNLNSGPGALATLGTGALTDLLGTDKYNPLNQTGMIKGLTDNIDYNTKQATDAAKRSAGYAGNLYSTDAVRNLGNVQAQGNNAKSTTLANLYSQYVQQKFSAIPQAFDAQTSMNAKSQQDLQNAFSYGGLPRSLNTARDQAQYAEFQRQQQEKQGQVGALTSVSGTPSNFGVPSVSIPQANPWADVVGLLAQFGGQYYGSKMSAGGSGNNGVETPRQPNANNFSSYI